MFVHHRTQSFVLKKTDRGEADQVLTIFTKDFGKLEILGRAIRKVKSKLRSGADLFYWSEIEFIQGKAYKTLTDVVLIDKFEGIRKDLNKLNTCQLTNLLTYQLIYYYFLWNLLSILGYQVDLHNCAVCQRKLSPQRIYFNPKEGGITCYKCSKKEKEISPEIVKILRILLKKDWNILLRLKVEEKHLESLELISQNYLQEHLSFKDSLV